MNVPTKDLKFMIFIKRGNKLITNKNTLAELKKANDYLKKFDSKNIYSEKSSLDDLSNKWKYKGRRTGLNLTPEKFAHIEILRELGINYKYLDEDFTTK
jgi:hypothetical protein